MAKQTVNRKEAVTMRKFGFTYKQIAITLGCSEQWCAAHLSNIKVDENYMDMAYKLFKKEADCTCHMCGMSFVKNEDSDYFLFHEQDRFTEKEFCSPRCVGHYLLDNHSLEQMFGHDYQKL